MSFYLAMFMYSISMAITPGPNNLISMAAGVRYGFKNVLPFVSGITCGFGILSLASGVGLGQIATGNTTFMKILGYGGTVIICYLAFKIATSKPEIVVNEKDKPKFIHGVIFQCINPKAWVGSIAGISAFKLVGNYEQLGIYIVMYCVLVFMSVSIWAYGGSIIVEYLSDQRRHRIFNIIMGMSLFAVALYLFFMQLDF